MILANVIKQVESKGDARALRFEPALFEGNEQWIQGQVPRAMAINRCSANTARMICCTSWGAYQMLGANIYALGFGRDIVSFAADNDDAEPAGKGLQFVYFSKFVYPKGFLPGEDVASWTDDRFREFEAFYNGPGANGAYAASMKQAAGLPALAA